MGSEEERRKKKKRKEDVYVALRQGKKKEVDGRKRTLVSAGVSSPK